MANISGEQLEQSNSRDTPSNFSLVSLLRMSRPYYQGYSQLFWKPFCILGYLAHFLPMLSMISSQLSCLLSSPASSASFHAPASNACRLNLCCFAHNALRFRLLPHHHGFINHLILRSSRYSLPANHAISDVDALQLHVNPYLPSPWRLHAHLVQYWLLDVTFVCYCTLNTIVSCLTSRQPTVCLAGSFTGQLHLWLYNSSNFLFCAI